MQCTRLDDGESSEASAVSCLSDCTHCLNIEQQERDAGLPELERDRPTYFISKQDSHYEELKRHVDLLNDTSLNLDNVILLDSKRRRLNVEFEDDGEEVKIESKLSPFISRR